MTDPIIETKSGPIRGQVVKHDDCFDYYAFKGIPYAEPPIGNLRFEDPVPIKKWTETLDCKNYGPICAQYDFVAQISSDSEDCLHLNIFTRAINEPNAKKAVIVISHVGNFAIGNSSDMFYGPDYVIRKDIVIVTINYRVGVLGFLNLEDEIAPGNQGLKDQILALKWIQQNIQAFGGDPCNVTFGGHSSGGSSAHYLAMSPLAKGLMHKIICLGSVVYNPWVTVREPKKNAIEICSLLGKKLEDPKEIKKFLKTLDIATLMDACLRFWQMVDHKPFGPGIDDKSPNPVIPTDRYTMADKGIHLPCLVGHNSRDGLIFLTDYVTFKGMPKMDFFNLGNKDFEKIVRYNAKEILDRYNVSPSQIKRFYYKGDAMSESNMDKFVDYCSDIYFHQGIHRFVRVQAEQSSAPTYFYVFNFDSPNNLSNGFTEHALKGASHLDDLSYLFKSGIFDKYGLKHVTKGTADYRVMEQMTEMWTNFAKYGRPTIELSELIPVHWKPVSNSTLLRYMSIDEDLTMQYTVNVEEKYSVAKQIEV